MGTWGHGIRQDDFVRDVVGAFEDRLKSGKSVAEASGAVKSAFARSLTDLDDGPQFWIALAEAQWKYGGVDPEVLKRVQEDLHSGKSLSRWTENERMLAARRAALETFIAKVAAPNPKPKKPPKLIVRPPIFRAGDCLSVLLSNGQYGAALVLADDHSNPEYGKNLVGVLDYMAPERPTLDEFRARKWLVLNHHNWRNKLDVAWYANLRFRAVKTCFEVVGRIDLVDTDPKSSDTYGNWPGLGDDVVQQREWDAGRR